MRLRKSLYISAIWMLPIFFIIIESFIFLPKTLRNSSFIPYFIVFWAVRALLAPAIVFYTFRWKPEYTRIFRQFLIHLLGFFLFSVLFWTISYLILYGTIHQNFLFNIERSATDLGVFTIIADNSLSTNIMVYASTVAFCYVWEFFRRNTEANKKAGELERSLLVSRMELLKGQLNTHFLFNSLHNISSLVVRKKNEEANRVLVKLSELLRFALKENKEQLIPLYKEMEVLQLYLDIQQTRFNDRMDVKISFPSSLKDAMVPPLILQPLVENAIKYAIEPFKEKGRIQVDINSEDKRLMVTVSDSGHTPFNTINFDQGIGLNNTRERLKQLFGEKQVFSIDANEDAGTKVSFSLPLQFSTNGTTENIGSG
jgi:two-component system LytT family sensor kinase